MYILKKTVKNILCFFLDIFYFFFIDPHGNKMVDRLGLDITHENIPPSRAFPPKFVGNARDFRLYPRMCRNQSESNEKFAENIVL